MSHPTGCVSIASSVVPPAVVERVIECFYASEGNKKGTIWVDIFFLNPSAKEDTLLVLHRGSLSAVDVTKESWAAEQQQSGSFTLSLANRIQQLHATTVPVVPLPGEKVRLGEHEYHLWCGPKLPRAIVGDKPGADVPFTMWELGPFAPQTPHILRLRLSMSHETFDTQVGTQGEFYAYGDAILLDKIENEDLPRYAGDDANDYRNAYKLFRSKAHVVPKVFEYLVVSPDNTDLGWETIPLSPMSSPQLLPHDLGRTTRWLITDNSHSDKFSLVGKRYNGLVVRVTSTQPATTSL